MNMRNYSHFQLPVSEQLNVLLLIILYNNKYC
jgi:hypothetical protein